MAKTAILYGATGLIGRHLLSALLACDNYQSVHVIARREVGVTHPKLSIHLCPGDKLHELTLDLTGADAFCCLGTTMKQAGSREMFRLVDHDFVVGFARLCLAQRASHFLLVSALGADERSRFFYNRVKGETERVVSALAFARVTMVRPSLLLGKHDTPRPGEAFAQYLSPLMVGPLAALRGIKGSDVAVAMLQLAALDRGEKVRIVPSCELQRLALSGISSGA